MVGIQLPKLYVNYIKILVTEKVRVAVYVWLRFDVE